MTITPRLAISLTFIAFGLIVGVQIGSQPVVLAKASVTSALFGILAGLGAVASISAMAISGYVSRWLDHRSAILFLVPVGYVAMVGNVTSASTLGFAVTFITLSFIMGALDINMNAEGTVVEHELKKPVLSSFHAVVLYALGLTGLASGYICATFGPLWAIFMPLPFLAAAMYAVNVAIPHRAEAVEEKSNVIGLPKGILAIIGLIIGLEVSAETACVQWSGQLLAEMQPGLVQFAGLGVAFYGLCNGTARLLGDALRKRFSDMTLVAASLCVGIFGFSVLATNPGFTVSIVAFAVTGAGLGLIFPCLFSVSVGLAPHARAAALGYASTISGPTRILFPMMVGGLAKDHGLAVVYTSSIVVCVLALGFTLLAARAISRRQAPARTLA